MRTFSILLASLGASLPTLHAANANPRPPVPVSVLSQSLAVKGICAWPKLTLLPSGDIAAAVYNQPSHGARPGDIDCYVSSDGGRNWERRGSATHHSGDNAYVNHAIGVNARGEIVILSSGWSYERKTDGGFAKSRLLRPLSCRSSDGGRTWTRVERFPRSRDGRELIPFGNLQAGPDGVLRVAAYAYTRGETPRRDVCHVVESRDDAETWTLGSVIAEIDANETDLMPFTGSTWLAAARNLGQPSHSIDIYESRDDARTWHKLASPLVPNQHPGDLLKLADGRVLLTYGDRRPPEMGIQVCVSSDGGKTWEGSSRISRGILTRDSGYPSTVQLADGTLVTAYYAAKTTEFDGYQMGVIRWRLPDSTAASTTDKLASP